MQDNKVQDTQTQTHARKNQEMKTNHADGIDKPSQPTLSNSNAVLITVVAVCILEKVPFVEMAGPALDDVFFFFQTKFRFFRVFT